MSPEQIKAKLKRFGLSGVNKPKRTPTHPTKKGVVLAKKGDVVKLIRFGDQSMGHNYSPEARKSFKARHAKNIAKGVLSATYRANRFFGAGSRESKKSPSKSKKHKKGV